MTQTIVLLDPSTLVPPRHGANNSTGREAFLNDSDLVLMPPAPAPFGTQNFNLHRPPTLSIDLRSETPTNPLYHARRPPPDGYGS